MAYIQGEGSSQGSLFLVILDDLILSIICAASSSLRRNACAIRSWLRARSSCGYRTPGYDPRDLLKLYLYGYLNQVRSSRRLEAECHRNVELMWLLGRLYPDKCISEFRRMHSEAMTAAGTALIRFARSCGLFRGEWIAIVCSIAAGLLLRSFWSVFAGTASTGSHIGI
jgi:transposase